MVIIVPCGVYASELTIDDSVRYDFIKDRVAQNGETFGQYKKIFETKGLDYEDIRDLQIMGYSFTDIALMNRNRIRMYIGGDVEPMYTRPSTYVRVTNVGGAGSSAVDYFHPNTGMEAGDFYSSTNNGTYKDGKVEDFIKDVYDVTSTSGFSYKYYYWDNGATAPLEHIKVMICIRLQQTQQYILCMEELLNLVLLTERF